MLKGNFPKFIFNIIVIVLIVVIYQNTFAEETSSFLTKAQQHYIEGVQRWINFIESNDETDLVKAIDRFKEAIKENSDFADAYFQLGIIYNIQGEKEEADKMLDKAVKLDPDFAKKVENIKARRVKTTAIPDVERFIQERSDDIEQFIQKMSKDEEKMQFFSEATSLQLEAQALLMKGMQAQEDKYYNQALKKINEAINLFTDYTGFYITKAQIYMQIGEYKKVEELLDKIVSMDSSYKEYADLVRRNISILSKISLEQRKECGEKTSELLKNFTQHEKFLEIREVEKLNRQGKKVLVEALLGDERKYDAAIGKFKEAIQMLSDDTASYYNLADTYAYQGNFKEANEILDKAINVRPKAVGVVKSKKITFEELQACNEYEFSKYKKRRADDYLEELGLKEIEGSDKQKIQEYFIDVEILLADDENDSNVDKAISLLNEIIELNPSLAEAHNRLGDIYFIYKNSPSEAVKFYENTIKFNPSNLDGRKGLAQCYQRLNKDELAKNEWEKVKELNPEDKEAKKYLNE